MSATRAVSARAADPPPLRSQLRPTAGPPAAGHDRRRPARAGVHSAAMTSGSAPATRRGGSRRPPPRRRPASAAGRTRAELAPPPAPPLPDTRRHAVAANRRRAASITFVPAAVVAMALLASVAAGVPVVAAAVVAVVLLGLAGAAWVLAAPLLVRRLGRLGAAPDEIERARLYNVVEGVCLASGVPQPALLLLDDPAPNLLSVGRASEDAVLAVTTGLLGLLDRIELEAVVAHEIAHVRSRDVHSGAVSSLVLGSLAPSLAARAAGSARETHADQAAVATTRYPPGLVAALGKLRDAGDVRPAVLPRGLVRSTGHLWLAPLAAPPPRGREVRGALDLEERIALLVEL